MDLLDGCMDEFYLYWMVESNLPSFISSQIKRGNYLIPDQREALGEDPGVTCAGWEDCLAGYRMDRRSFRYPALEYIAGGIWELSSEAGRWVLTPGSVFCYGPDTRYVLKATATKGLSKYFLDLSPRCGMDLLEQTGLQKGIPGMVFQHRWLRDLFDQLIDIRNLSADCQRNLSELTLRLMLERLREDLRHGEQKSQAWIRFEACRAYLSENYISLTSLTEAARQCGVSPAYMSRLFNRFSNESPKAFVVRMKMNHAAERLLRSNCPMQQAASEIGYEDVFHFSRAFKKCFGLSPSHFVKRSQGQGAGS